MTYGHIIIATFFTSILTLLLDNTVKLRALIANKKTGFFNPVNLY